MLGGRGAGETQRAQLCVRDRDKAERQRNTSCAHVSPEGAGEMHRDRFLELQTALWEHGAIAHNGVDTEDLCFHLKMEFGGVFAFH